jgi:hypothetical protein
MFKKIGEYLLVSLVSILAPIKGMLLTVGFLVFMDTITGVLAARKKNIPIKSARLRDMVSKSLIYMSAILVFYLAETQLLGGALPLSKIVAGSIASVELMSLVENYNVLTGTNLFDSLKKVLGSVNRQNSQSPSQPEQVQSQDQQNNNP